jgi:outer membrane protein OmpA-like peptidoglycan-associated protein
MRRTFLKVVAVLAPAFGLGCAHVTPPELIEARQAYEAATKGQASKLAPADLYSAQKTLDAANKTFDDEGDTQKVKDYAYVALRKVELAEARGRSEAERRKIAEAAKAGVQIRDLQVKDVQSQLAKTREELQAERRQRELASQELQKTGQQLELEKQGRLAAEAKVAAAMKDLQEIAAVKEEARGMVITLSGSVLFASGKWNLLQTAQMRLDQVAEALKATDDDKGIVIEGHTDTNGSAATNKALSLRRAEAVRQHLIAKGVPVDRISAVGVGESRPVADNDTAEGRANNRRVEIIIGNSAGASSR